MKVIQCSVADGCEPAIASGILPVQDLGVPELPDINAYLHALDSRIVGRVLQKVRLGSPFVLRTAQPPMADAEGRVVRRLPADCIGAQRGMDRPRSLEELEAVKKQ